jgi:hypothetical protein
VRLLPTARGRIVAAIFFKTCHFNLSFKKRKRRKRERGKDWKRERVIELQGGVWTWGVGLSSLISQDPKNSAIYKILVKKDPFFVSMVPVWEKSEKDTPPISSFLLLVRPRPHSLSLLQTDTNT